MPTVLATDNNGVLNKAEEMPGTAWVIKAEPKIIKLKEICKLLQL